MENESPSFSPPQTSKSRRYEATTQKRRKSIENEMSDVTQSSDKALRALQHESGSSSSGSGLIPAKIERSPSPPLRPSSPEAACPICLEDINNSSVTNSCAHRFCFSCLCEWSKVKPECPLCKQRFTIIFHTIKSMIDFQEYRLDQALLQPRLDPPRIFVTLQQGSRPAFGYRTTMGFHGFESAVSRVSAVRRMMLVSDDLLSPGSRVSSTDFTPSAIHQPNTTGTMTRASAYRASLEFRRNVYRHNLWVRPSPDQDRIRESSPAFYRLNPALTHRLVPWLSRELTALLEPNALAQENACRAILNLLYTYSINSNDFRQLVQHHFRANTNHFTHEFYHFAISPHDLPAYDSHARYVSGLEDASNDGSFVDDTLPHLDVFERPYQSTNDSTVFPSTHGTSAIQHLDERIRSVTRGLVIDLRHTARQIAMSRSLISLATSASSRGSSFSPLPLGSSERSSVPEVITLSSDEGDLADDASDDSDVQIICSLPPHHLRPPVEITSDSDDSDVIMIPVPSPPIIEIKDDDDDEPVAVEPSPSLCSTFPTPELSSTNCGEGTSNALQNGPTNRKRTSRFTRPFYREFSSSTDDDNPEHTRSQPRKPSSANKRARSAKRTRKYKSYKFVRSDSDSESENTRLKTDIEKTEESDQGQNPSTWGEDVISQRSCRRSIRSQKNMSSSSSWQPTSSMIEPSNRAGSSSLKMSRKREKFLSSSSNSHLSSRSSSSNIKKKIPNFSKKKNKSSHCRGSSGNSFEEKSCSQCSRTVVLPSIPSGSNMKRCKDSSGCYKSTESGDLRLSSSNSSESTSTKSADRGTKLATEKPKKALSKKDIILNKRLSEVSTLAGLHHADNDEDAEEESRSSILSSDNDDAKSDDTILSMGQEFPSVDDGSDDHLSSAERSSLIACQLTDLYNTRLEMSPPSLRRFDDNTPANGSSSPVYYPKSSSSTSSSSSSSPLRRGGPPRLKSIVVRPAPHNNWLSTSHKNVSSASPVPDENINDEYSFS